MSERRREVRFLGKKGESSQKEIREVTADTWPKQG